MWDINQKATVFMQHRILTLSQHDEIPEGRTSDIKGFLSSLRNSSHFIQPSFSLQCPQQALQSHKSSPQHATLLEVHFYTSLPSTPMSPKCTFFL